MTVLASAWYSVMQSARPQPFHSRLYGASGCFMGRTLIYPFAGAGIGFLVAFVIVRLMAGPSPPSDTTAITLLVGTFLAGTGAIAGAILGGVESFKRRQQASKEPVQRESESES